MSTKEDRDIVASLWPDMKTSVTGQYFCTERPFAIPRAGNKVSINKDGETNFRRVHDAIKNAETFIFIVDWQLSIDFELIRPAVGKRAEDGHPYRLSELLAAKVMEGVDVRILIYDSPSLAESAVPTYDSAVAGIINSMAAELTNAGAKGSLQCIQQGPTSAQLDAWDYSHHQKMVLVDGKVGFVGGMDLTNGRWDTTEFDCVVNPERYTINDMYNPCLSRDCAPAASELAMTKPLMDGQAKALVLKDGRRINVQRPGFAPAQYNPKSGKVLDPGTQPRMPWQDVHIMIEGPALIDLYKNVVRRLDGYITVRELDLAAAQQNHSRSGVGGPTPAQIRARIKAKVTPQPLLDKWRGAVAKNAVKHPQGSALVQVVRSVSNRQLRGEAYDRLDDLKLETAPGRAKLWEQAIQKWQGEHQDNIYQAMLACIASARAYIYIETQFFISEHGGASNTFIDNKIVNAIASKVIDMARAGKGFHVYLVLPVHPEGAPSNEATYKQQRLAMDTLRWGPSSLFNRIKQATGRTPEDFITVLNLRTHGVVVQYARDKDTNEIDMTYEIGRYVVTEQIYVHSKLLIVDDAVAIIGSANTNDRSLTGNGDSEIAAVVVDTEDVQVLDLGNGSKIPTRKFARELRQTLWRKHLGLDIPEDSSKAGKLFQNASESARGKDAGRPKWILDPPHPPRVGPRQEEVQAWEARIKLPAANSTWTQIQKLAKKNTAAYEAVFPHIPSNRLRKFDEGLQYYAVPMSYSDDRHKRWVMETSRGVAVNQGLNGEALAQHMRQVEQSVDAQLAKAPAERQRLRMDDRLSGPPPALSQMPPPNTPKKRGFMAAPQDFQKRLAGYRMYQVGADRPANRGMDDALQVHDCEWAIEYLRGALTGFWVEAPMAWGVEQTVLNKYTTSSGVDLTLNEEPAPSPHGALERPQYAMATMSIPWEA